MKYIVAFIFILSLTIGARGATITLQAVVRDFWPCVNPKWELCGKEGLPAAERFTCDQSLCHQDFENACCSGETGALETTLDSEKKPVLKNKQLSHFTTQANFAQWFRDSPKSKKFYVDMVFDNNVYETKFNEHVYGYKNNEFWVINGKGWGNYQSSRNFHFTMEIHTRFTYRGGEEFKFVGDDDLFVFIDGKLVIDLGGVHAAQTATVKLDELGLTKNTNYDFDLFFAERHTTASNFVAYTGIEFICPFKDHCGICNGDGQSCCTCNDNKQCTIDTCDAETGACIFTQRTDLPACTGGVTCPDNTWYRKETETCQPCSELNNCNGKGTCTKQGCQCSTGYTGSTCAECVAPAKGETRICVPTGNANSPYKLISVETSKISEFLDNKQMNQYPAHIAQPRWTPNDDTNPGTPVFGCDCSFIENWGPVPTCPSNSEPYTLLTPQTASIKATSSVWLQLYFKGGCYHIPQFKVTLEGVPNAGFQYIPEAEDFADINYNNYTLLYVQYPSSRAYTMLYKDEQLSASEQDFVAFRLSLPQVAQLKTFDINVVVDYRVRGVDRQNKHKVVVPVVPSTGTFNLVAANPAGPYIAGTATWIAVSFTGLHRLVGFQLSFESPSLSFTYPTNGDGTYTSLYWDDQLDVDETDYAAVRAVVPQNACSVQLQCQATGTYTIKWLTNNANSEAVETSEKRSFAVTLQKATTKRAVTGPYTLTTSTINGFGPGVGGWVLVSFEGGSSTLPGFKGTLNGPIGVTINYPVDTETYSALRPTPELKANGDGYLAFYISATQAGEYDLTLQITYEGGSAQENIKLIVPSKEFELLNTQVELGSDQANVLIPFYYNGNKTINEVDVAASSGALLFELQQVYYNSTSSSYGAIFTVGTPAPGSYNVLITITYKESGNTEFFEDTVLFVRHPPSAIVDVTEEEPETTDGILTESEKTLTPFTKNASSASLILKGVAIGVAATVAVGFFIFGIIVVNKNRKLKKVEAFHFKE